MISYLCYQYFVHFRQPKLWKCVSNYYIQTKPKRLEFFRLEIRKVDMNEISDNMKVIGKVNTCLIKS